MWGVKQGKGKLTLPKVTTCQGEFVNNLLEGEGTQWWKDGSIYKGQFKNSRKNGYGILT